MQCPNCGNAIDADFGVVTCGHCQAVFSVGIDGEIERSGFSSPQGFEAIANESPAEEPLEIPSTLPSDEIEVIEIAESQEAMTEREPEDLVPISDFMNADVSVAGPLNYTLTIEGLDNKQLYQDVQQVLSEPRLMIDAHSVMKTVRLGKLEIRGLNPVKTSRIVGRLAEMPLKISWRQTVYDH